MLSLSTQNCRKTQVGGSEEIRCRTTSKHPKRNRLLQNKVEKLHEKMVMYGDTQNELLADRGKLCKLYQEDIINSDGEYIPRDHD